MKTNEISVIWNMKSGSRIRWTLLVFLSFWLLAPCWAQLPPARSVLPGIDQRQTAGQLNNVLPAQKSEAAAALRQAVPSLKVEFEPVTGSAKSVMSANGFLTGPAGKGATISAASLAGFATSDSNRVTKAFLSEHRALFGHGPEALAQARISRDYVAPNNGLHTVVWEQQVDGILVFEGVLISHTTSKGELVSLSSQFVSDPEAAATRGTPNRAALVGMPALAASRAVSLAAQNMKVDLAEKNVEAIGAAAGGAERRQKFKAPGLKGEAEAKLIWLPMSAEKLRLCWDVVLMNRQRGEMYRVLLDAESGEVLVRSCLTSYLTDASYNVFTSDSPSPFSPGWPTPNTNQPASVARTLVTLPAMDTNASPAGWINDGGNETWGNNVDAHTDRNADDSADLPRPQGSPFRVFNFPMDLTTQDPTNYASATVVQLFYLCNWYHDKLYALGFTEAAGNFQSNNFARGGAGGDAVQADAQDGSGTDNANFSTPPDGSAGRMQMYIFTGPSPRRDGDLDAEIVFHEATHGLSWRLVGGGQALGDTQSDGMGEGWSDFYGLSLLSEAGDDANGAYAMGGYVTYQLGGLMQNYYYGIRRYPYSTDMTKSPLTFKDIDPAQASTHAGIPRSPIIGTTADEVHNEGEVWCVTLWEARANLINKYGWATGNQLILQLVTDGMKLTPPHPNFLQARDAILQADLVDTGGANRNELWAAFAKRGMGFSATSPASSTTTGVHESFDMPDNLWISPAAGFVANGPVGGPFTPASQSLILTNIGTNSLTWSLVNTSAWLNVSPTGGTLTTGGPSASVTASLTATANTLSKAIYSSTVLFSNLTSGVQQSRQFTLLVGQPTDWFTELFNGVSSTNDLAFHTFTFTPNGSDNSYSLCQQAAFAFPTDPTGGTTVPLTDDSFAQVTLSGANTVAIYNRRTNVFFIGSNGYLTMDAVDPGSFFVGTTFSNHFSLPRVSALFDDLDPGAAGAISWKSLADRVAVTYQNVPEYGTTTTNSFQIELFYDGRITLTYLQVSARAGLAGLSGGLGVPVGFVASDLTLYGACAPQPPVIVTQPTNQIVPVGGTATFSVTSTGSTPLSYFWQRNGTPITGANAATYSTNNVQLADSGSQFSCLVSNAYGTLLSSNAALTVVNLPSDYFTELFGATITNLAFTTYTFTPDGSVNFYGICKQSATAFPTDPTGGIALGLTDDSYLPITLVGGNTVAIYNTRTSVIYVGSNGYLTMNAGDISYSPTYANHFARPRLSAIYRDLNPGAGGTVTWKQLSDRVAITYQAVPVYGVATQTNSFQFELFFDGRIRLTYLSLRTPTGLVGLSAGTGQPVNFIASDFTAYGSCAPVITLVTLLSGGNIQISLTGSSGDIYRVLGSTNLLDWQTIASVTNLTGIVQFTDSTATNYNQRFYRLAIP